MKQIFSQTESFFLINRPKEMVYKIETLKITF